VRVFGVDPGSLRTGYGCIDTDGSRHRLVACGAIVTPAASAFPDKLLAIYRGLSQLLRTHRPDCVVVENVFHAMNVRSALKLGHARGVALLSAVEGGYPLVEYTPAEIKLAVVGFGRAEKHQVGEMVRLLLGLTEVPQPHDASDALAVAICHVHRSSSPVTAAAAAAPKPRGAAKTWREYRP